MTIYRSAHQRSWDGRNVLVVSPTPTAPLDFGNRKRVYFVAQRLRQMGARITFIHYPAESDWRNVIPRDAQAAMQRMWDDYYVVPPTRELHAAPSGREHRIDEWWDPAIGTTLSWLTAKEFYDTIIVNYTWLSKALEFVGPGVLKILDTHDQFSGRRELLNSYGIAPEFFYTNAAEEAIALNRADIVWAIKDKERVYFESISHTRVLTLLHIEPMVPLPAGEQHKVTRFGIVGARNHINMVNIKNFLDAAKAYIRHTLLPCEIWVAGSCCELIDASDVPFIKLVGFVPDLRTFYAQVDVILGPMEFSTGLKIKIGEALSYGKAIIAHEHCFEGYVATNPFQTLPNFRSMLDACRFVIDNPASIRQLEEDSIRSAYQADRLIVQTLAESLKMDEPVPSKCIVFVVNAVAVMRRTIELDHLCEAADYLRNVASLVFWIDIVDGAEITENLVALSRFGRLAFSPSCEGFLRGQGAKSLGGAAPLFVELWELSAANQIAFWFACLPSASCLERRFLQTLCIVPLNLLAVRHDEERIAEFVDLLNRTGKEVLLTGSYINPSFCRLHAKVSNVCQVPVLWRGHHSFILSGLKTNKGTAVCLNTSGHEMYDVQLLVDIILSCSDRDVIVLVESGARELHQVIETCSTAGRVQVLECEEYVDQIARGRGNAPCMSFNVGSSARNQCLSELFRRAGIPVVQFFAAGCCSEFDGQLPLEAAGTAASISLLGEYLLGELGIEKAKEKFTQYEPSLNDAGWTRIWKVLREERDSVGAGASMLGEHGRLDLGSSTTVLNHDVVDRACLEQALSSSQW